MFTNFFQLHTNNITAQVCETKATVKTVREGEDIESMETSPVSKSVSSIADAFTYLKASKNTKSLGLVSETLSKESKYCSTQFRPWKELSIPCKIGAEGVKDIIRDVQQAGRY